MTLFQHRFNLFWVLCYDSFAIVAAASVYYVKAQSAPHVLAGISFHCLDYYQFKAENEHENCDVNLCVHVCLLSCNER